MKELIEYRRKLVERFGESARELCAAYKSIGDPFAKLGDGWNLHQIAAHTRDVQKLVYGMRIERTLSEVDPEFANFDADEWMAAHYDSREPLEKILDEFMRNADALRRALDDLPREAWSRESRHEALGGGLTLQLWVERNLAHIEEHLNTVKQSAGV